MQPFSHAYACVNPDSVPDGRGSPGYVVAIKRALVGGWGVSVVGINADVNADGSVDLRDAALITRYLAGGWSVVLK